MLILRRSGRVSVFWVLLTVYHHRNWWYIIQYYSESESLCPPLKTMSTLVPVTLVSQHFANCSFMSFCFTFLTLRFAWRCLQIPQGKYLGWQKAFLCQQNISKLLFYIYSFNYSSLSCQTFNYFHINTCCMCVYVCFIWLIFIIRCVSPCHALYYAGKPSSYTIYWKPRAAHQDKLAGMIWKMQIQFSFFPLSGKDHIGRADVIHGQTHFLQQQQHGLIVKL